MAAALVGATCGAATGQTISIDTGRMLRTFHPDTSLGSTVDKEPAGSIPRLYSRRNVRAMLGAGFGWLSYRLFTELVVQDWHWNPNGAFTQGDRGYWTSASTPRTPITDSFGYRLPHRGFTTDQGASEDYSRLDDGDEQTYWKSNPYLSSSYTGEPDSMHPQWAIVDLGSRRSINTVRILWSAPYATQFSVQYWSGEDAMNDPAHGEWHALRGGSNVHGTGGISILRFFPRVFARFVRVLLMRSSNTCDTHGTSDRRNCLGYAIAEIGVGRYDKGRFGDYVRHARGQDQSRTYVSSVDPWHSATNRVRNQEQPGLDLIERSGLTRALGTMYPVPLLYSTPQNAVNEVAYLRARGYHIGRIEIGEEPDGQYATPEDYGALYVQWARALHRLDPALQLGGPVFSGVNRDLPTWADASGNVSWLNRFLHYLKRRHAMSQLSFMSFEHYPFGGCEHGARLLGDLRLEPALIRNIVRVWRADGLPATVPMYITEANFSAVNATQIPMQIEGALWQADYMASALSNGVSGAVYYQYEPVPLTMNKRCPGDWGNLTMFAADRNANIRARTAQYFAGLMLTRVWLAPGHGEHELHNTHSGPDTLISAYGVKRPDGLWSILIINKDSRARAVTVRFGGPVFEGSVTRVSFGQDQYVWRSRGAASRPDPNAPPAAVTIRANHAGTYIIPARSITVLRGHLRRSGIRVL
jgi:F5/8 type C domain